ncbi:putative cytochrome b5 reductase 4-like isoform X3 [Apostichopus japonicus]|uniref:Cytochrome b5 reductase 4 n=1 Tax=Stichopus japonicus TaxID=307972 RepID=A0A2G8JV21_STIJA|nr:putative cytochrome b5 reductase 4-like isoform X3 [Apostichopus japonicus]
MQSALTFFKASLLKLTAIHCVSILPSSISIYSTDFSLDTAQGIGYGMWIDFHIFVNMNNPGGLQVPQAQFPALNSQQRLSPNVPAGKGDSTKSRRKIGLTPGHSLMDWVRMANQKGRVLNGISGNIVEISKEELAKHNLVEDAWTCIRGKVYNISPYMDFHPGGAEELMRAAGKDGTNLFNEFHQWVNIDSLLDKCFIGKLKMDSVPGSRVRASKKPVTAPLLKPPETQIDGKISAVSVQVPTHEGPPKARYDWYQKDDAVYITVYAKCKNIAREHVIIDHYDQTFRAILYLDDHIYTVCLDLSAEIQRDIQVRVRSGPVNRADFILKKTKPGHWTKLGVPKDHNDELQHVNERELIFRKCKVHEIMQINHNTKVITCELPEGTVMHVPTGYHVYLQMEVDGALINRPYTVITPSLQNSEHTKQAHSGRFLNFMIKIYSDGRLTRHIENLKTVSNIQISDFEGNFDESRLKKCTDMVLLAAGTGLTPMIRLISQTTAGNLQKSCIKLLFFNKTESDILWRSKMEQLEQQQKSFKLINILSDADNAWPWLRGRVTENLLRQQLADLKPAEFINRLICVCGPTPFTQAAFRCAYNMFCSQ